MKYENIVKGYFIDRPNRFIGNVQIDGKIQRVHIKNTGRCKELLLKDAVVYLEDFQGRMGQRKLRYSLIGVEKKINSKGEEDRLLINMDSQAPNKVVEEALLDSSIQLPNMAKLSLIKREKTHGNSRFDFWVADENGKEAYIEVKGVTLEIDGDFTFPDAPTERGVKHVMELVALKEQGYEAFVIFVIQMDKHGLFYPNKATHQDFVTALRIAESKGVGILAYNCMVEIDSLSIKEQLPTKI